MDITIGVINWNSKDLLKACLGSIYLQTNGLDFELIVVDNNSSDGSAGMAGVEFPRAKIIRNSMNLGFSKAVNQVIRMSSAEFVFIANSDILFKKNTLKKMLDFIKSDERIAILGPRLINEEGKPELSFNSSCSGFMRCIFDNIFFYSDLRTKLMEKYLIKMFPDLFKLAFTKARPVAWVAGAAFILRKIATKDAGLMDENFFIYCEDEDFGCRMNKAGWQVCYFPQAEVVHLRERSIRKFEGNLNLESVKSKVYFYRKRHNPLVVFFVKLLLFYRFTLESLIFEFCEIFAKAPKEEGQKKKKQYLEVLEKLMSL